MNCKAGDSLCSKLVLIQWAVKGGEPRKSVRGVGYLRLTRFSEQETGHGCPRGVRGA